MSHKRWWTIQAEPHVAVYLCPSIWTWRTSLKLIYNNVFSGHSNISIIDNSFYIKNTYFIYIKVSKIKKMLVKEIFLYHSQKHIDRSQNLLENFRSQNKQFLENRMKLQFLRKNSETDQLTIFLSNQPTFKNFRNSSIFSLKLPLIWSDIFLHVEYYPFVSFHFPWKDDAIVEVSLESLELWFLTAMN